MLDGTQCMCMTQDFDCMKPDHYTSSLDTALNLSPIYKWITPNQHLEYRMSCQMKPKVCPWLNDIIGLLLIIAMVVEPQWGFCPWPMNGCLQPTLRTSFEMPDGTQGISITKSLGYTHAPQPVDEPRRCFWLCSLDENDRQSQFEFTLCLWRKAQLCLRYDLHQRSVTMFSYHIYDNAMVYPS